MVRFDSCFSKVCSQVPVDKNLGLVRCMGWRWRSYKPLPVPMATHSLTCMASLATMRARGACIYQVWGKSDECFCFYLRKLLNKSAMNLQTNEQTKPLLLPLSLCWWGDNLFEWIPEAKHQRFTIQEYRICWMISRSYPRKSSKCQESTLSVLINWFLILAFARFGHILNSFSSYNFSYLAR